VEEISLSKYWIALLAAIVFAMHAQNQAHAQSDPNSAMVFYPSCLAAADIVQGKHPAADSEDATKQLRQAAICFGAVTTIMNVEGFFKPEFAVCPPEGTKVSVNQMIPVITGYLKNHPERLRDNFHQLAVTALAAAWPCSK
jgi:Rap1a immunity proteins